VYDVANMNIFVTKTGVIAAKTPNGVMITPKTPPPPLAY